MELSEQYGWEVETISHEVIRQYNEDGSENPSTLIPFDQVVRFSVVPRVEWLPRHDVLVDPSRGERVVRRFGRGIMKNRGDGIKLAEYLQCVVTNSYRLWVFSTSGRALVANADYEVYP